MKGTTWQTITFSAFFAFLSGGCDNGPSVPPCTPAAEVCDARDNDCDGEVDEADSGGPLRRDCSNACGPGTEECNNGVWGYCTAPQPTDEICNGYDDNCDGRIDEIGCGCEHGDTQPCGEAIGVCERGVRHCERGVWGECQLPYDPNNLVEICNDGLDNDCDGEVDEDCICEPGDTQTCGSSEGTCEAGLQTCGEDSQWMEECVGEVGPEPDVCDGLDNDCDGEVDYVTRIDFGWDGDDHEPNNTCADAAPLYNSDGELYVVEGGDVVSPSVDDPTELMEYPTLYPPGDEDWYYTRTREETGCSCWTPWCEDCAFRLTVQLWLADHALVEGAVQTPEDWRLCVNLGDCMGGESFCTHMDDWFESDSLFQISVIWGNGCGQGDPRDVKIQVHSPTGAACGHYQLYVMFEFDDSLECPE